ncbi:MAG: baseplate multidomain protein megatron [Halocynthiibacter sp.]
MATLVLSAAGMAVGGAIGGTVMGLSTALVGRAVGGVVGRLIDQRLMGGGSQVVETGRIDRLRLMGASEGGAITQVYGRMRVPGDVIWASNFLEHKSVTTQGSSGGGKGSRPTTTTTTTRYSYSVSLAVALCEGEVSGIGRIWANGEEISASSYNMRVYKGDQSQLPDAKIEAVEGAGNAPAYRGVAYVVFEDLPLAPFGNRIPQFNFEVMRPAEQNVDQDVKDMSQIISAVSLIPGSGEYTLATTPVRFSNGLGGNKSANVNTVSGRTDFVQSFDMLKSELPHVQSVSLVVSWFGDDLRAGQCLLKPKVERKTADGVEMPWRVNGVTRAAAEQVPYLDGRPVYGGTPTDASVVQAIHHMRQAGKEVLFYPFLMMEQIPGNGNTNPYDPASEQPKLPWRGRITTSLAPNVAGTSDGTAAADAEVASFFGSVGVWDFYLSGSQVGYSGPNEWSYRRFVLHNAWLCKAAGGVDSFCIGSEMRGLTQIRGATGFPAVQALKQLAADVRLVLGPNTKIGYAADWSEYFGYHPQDGSGDVYFHLDPLWGDANIDFIGIDNYMPMSDWRDGDDHLDKDWGSIHNIEYLKSQVEGGEGYAWYYASQADRDAQIRSPITDGAHGEDWIYRYKDIKGWWSNEHYDRVGGVKASTPSDWVPGSKPIWFTELGCAAINKGANQPNLFLDPKSVESALPHYSNGDRDDLMQMQYLRAIYDYWSTPANNPYSPIQHVQMVDISKAHVWAFDARPFPFFPSRRDVWSDGGNYARGHWLNGRSSARSLASVVAEICERSGLKNVDISNLHGVVRGYSVDRIGDGREALQPLMLAYGFEAVERGGRLVFQNRVGKPVHTISEGDLARPEDQDHSLETKRDAYHEALGRVQLNYVESEGDYAARTTEATFPGEAATTVSQSEVPLALTQNEAQQTVEQWLSEAQITRDTAKFALPPSRMDLGAGDVVQLKTEARSTKYRIDFVEEFGTQLVEAVRTEDSVYAPSVISDTPLIVPVATPVMTPHVLMLDLPLLRGDEVPHAPYVAATADPWTGAAAVYKAPDDHGYNLSASLDEAAIIGVLQSSLLEAPRGVVDRGADVTLEIGSGVLTSVTHEAMLNGANVAAIGDGGLENWEIIQFEEATLIGTKQYRLRHLLRGQAGSKVQSWTSGSSFVLLNSALEQIAGPISERGLNRHYRVGPAVHGYEEATYTHLEAATDGIGLRPYAPVHLRALKNGMGEFDLSWIRRTRENGDSWLGYEVPVGESSERYLVRVLNPSGTILREEITTSPNWTYTQADQTSDGVTPVFHVDVAQLSEIYGPGLFERIECHV